MNWHKLSDREFDRQIKRHVEGSELPFDPSAWDKMDKKLDRVFPSDGNGVIGLMLLVLALSAAFFWGMADFAAEASNAMDQTRLSAAAVTTEKSIMATNDQSQDLLRPSESTTIPMVQPSSDEKPRSTTNSDSGIVSDAGERPDKNAVVTAAVHKEQNPGGHAFDSNGFQADNKSTVISKGLSTASVTYESGSVASLIAARDNFTEPMEPKPLAANTSGIVDIALPDSLHHTELSPIVSQHGNSGWVLGLGYAPDLSLVGFGQTTRPGNNLGLSVEYQISSRWSIQTGIIYSMKKYQATGDDYHPPYGFWDYGEIPEEMDATCDVLDIPINVRYYFSANTKSRFFGSTGLSSYVMLSEDYYYRYDGYPDPGVMDSWHVKNENQHYFGVYNLSLGYQKALGIRWFLEIEPFVKLPLSGIGFGKVDLWSTGSMFSIKYQIR